MSKPLGIDKVTLFLPVPELTVEPHFPAKIHNTHNAATGESGSQSQLFFNGRDYVTGKLATYNTDDYQVTIMPDRGGRAPNCMVQWSARAFAGSNEAPMQRDELFAIASRVEKELDEIGLHFPFSKARITRLDIAKNVELSHPVSSYAPVFDSVGGRRSMDKQDFGGTGFLMRNTQRQIAFYDKGAEMHAKGLDLAECPINTLRPECRLMKGRVVADTLGVESLSDLHRGWDKLPGAYNEALERDVFRAKMEKRIGANLDFHEEARFIMDSEYQRKWQAFKSEAFLLMMVERFGLDHAKNFVAFALVEDPGSMAGKRQIKRMHQELEQASVALKMCEQASERTPLQLLYKELKRAVLC